MIKPALRRPAVPPPRFDDRDRALRGAAEFLLCVLSAARDPLRRVATLLESASEIVRLVAEIDAGLDPRARGIRYCAALARIVEASCDVELLRRNGVLPEIEYVRCRLHAARCYRILASLAALAPGGSRETRFAAVV